ncbi:recombinase family protein [Trichothermofontia sp.]
MNAPATETSSPLPEAGLGGRAETDALSALWVTGPTRSGKTARLLTALCRWVEQDWPASLQSSPLVAQPPTPSRKKSGWGPRTLPILGSETAKRQYRAGKLLVLAANRDNRLELSDRLNALTGGQYPVRLTTPVGFFQDEVLLFWPLLIQTLQLRAQFPIRLRPENEQELATRLWRSRLLSTNLVPGSANEARQVRHWLDLFQLAALSGTPMEEIPAILDRGLVAGGEGSLGIPWSEVGVLLQEWRTWCLARGLLSYGLICELYWRYLLPLPTYRHHLQRRYRVILADDVDEYPAIAAQLFQVLLQQGAVGIFTFNPEGAIRLGLGADPDAFTPIAQRCQIERLDLPIVPSLGQDWAEPIRQMVTDPSAALQLPESIQALQTVARSQLLRQTADFIIQAVRSGAVEPHEIAVIGPGMDAIARYTLTEILTKQGIAVESLKEQRPLASLPMIRALLTLLALVYPGLGRLVDRDGVAEMLVVLGQAEISGISRSGVGSRIDPVRAGLITDHCFEPHPESPRLLPVQAFPRWDRLGYEATTAYEDIRDWVAKQRVQQVQHLLASPIVLLDRAIQTFLWPRREQSYAQVAALRELMETAQHYWEVAARLQADTALLTPLPDPHRPTPTARRSLPDSVQVLANFIQLLRGGAVTANPYPVRLAGLARSAVTLANVFQYRSSRRSHRWQFWLDAGSPRWLTGSDALYAAPLFLSSWSGQPWTAADQLVLYEQRLQRILRDLLGRTGERLFLCHSDLATNGQEQLGPLLAIVNAALPAVMPVVSELPSP